MSSWSFKFKGAAAEIRRKVEAQPKLSSPSQQEDKDAALNFVLETIDASGQPLQGHAEATYDDKTGVLLTFMLNMERFVVPSTAVDVPEGTADPVPMLQPKSEVELQRETQAILDGTK